MNYQSQEIKFNFQSYQRKNTFPIKLPTENIIRAYCKKEIKYEIRKEIRSLFKFMNGDNTMTLTTSFIMKF
ncbi:hypothetical protein BpHYR1_013705 [Brachionus plicatilis]|uniref:Uncharacterized protein n=1 Tax=Brachionus plicatilis TaxID=10195 RepID=A0A3M7RMG2_BRAPC|nr:hypothetical protein BpHYR1_013705 [Brachionus plicatilis]